MYTENSLGTISCQCSVATLAHLVSNHAPHQQNAYDNQSINLFAGKFSQQKRSGNFNLNGPHSLITSQWRRAAEGH